MRHVDHWEHIPEMVPELVVPDLEGFKLKPYVSYRAKEIYQVGVLSSLNRNDSVQSVFCILPTTNDFHHHKWFQDWFYLLQR